MEQPLLSSDRHPINFESMDPTDPYRRIEQTFPRLTDSQIESIRPFGEELELDSGHWLFQRGDREIDFWVVLRGAIEIFETEPCGGEKIFVVLNERSFTGELHLFNSNKTLVGGRTSGSTRVIHVKRKNFRPLLNADPDLAEVI